MGLGELGNSLGSGSRFRKQLMLPTYTYYRTLWSSYIYVVNRASNWGTPGYDFEFSDIQQMFSVNRNQKREIVDY